MEKGRKQENERKNGEWEKESIKEEGGEMEGGRGQVGRVCGEIN